MMVMLRSSFAAKILARKTILKNKNGEIWLISKSIFILFAENNTSSI